MGDFRKVLETFRPSGQHSQEYRQEQANTGQARLGMPLPSCPAGNVTMASVSCCVAGVQHPDLCRLVQHPLEYRQEQASDGQPCDLKNHHYSSPREYIRHTDLLQYSRKYRQVQAITVREHLSTVNTGQSQRSHADPGVLAECRMHCVQAQGLPFPVHPALGAETPCWPGSMMQG